MLAQTQQRRAHTRLAIRQHTQRHARQYRNAGCGHNQRQVAQDRGEKLSLMIEPKFEQAHKAK